MAREEPTEPKHIDEINHSNEENSGIENKKSFLDKAKESTNNLLNKGLFNSIPVNELSNLNIGEGKATTSNLIQPQNNFESLNGSLPSTSNTLPSSFSTLNTSSEKVDETQVKLPQFDALEKPLEVEAEDTHKPTLSRSDLASPRLHKQKYPTNLEDMYIPDIHPNTAGSYRLDGKLDGQEVIDWLNTPQLPDQADLYQDVYHSYAHFDDEQDNPFSLKENSFIHNFVNQSTSEDVVSFLTQTRYTDEVYGLPSFLKKFFDDLPLSDFNQPIQTHHINAINRLLQLKSHLGMKLHSDNPTVTKKELDTI